jgi:hypothetical protein
MLERVALAAGRLPSLALAVFAATLVDARRAPPPVVRLAAPAVAQVAAPVGGAPVEVLAPAVRVEPAPPPTNSWPRLTHDGFAGMSRADMASIGAVLDAFPDAVLTPRWSAHRFELDPPVDDLIRFVVRAMWGDFASPEHYVEIDVDRGRATRVTVTRPGVVTEHGLQVGEPLAGVLRIASGRRCELKNYFADASQSFKSYVRCDVTSERGVLRYEGSALLAALGGDGDPPAAAFRGGPALDRWIEEGGAAIDAITWLPRAR